MVLENVVAAKIENIKVIHGINLTKRKDPEVVRAIGKMNTGVDKAVVKAKNEIKLTNGKEEVVHEMKKLHTGVGQKEAVKNAAVKVVALIIRSTENERVAIIGVTTKCVKIHHFKQIIQKRTS